MHQHSLFVEFSNYFDAIEAFVFAPIISQKLVEWSFISYFISNLCFTCILIVPTIMFKDKLQYPLGSRFVIN
jgi:hypothetical protein